MEILDGKALSQQIVESVKEKAVKLKPKLVVIMVGENPASQVYVRNKMKACEKAGIAFEEREFNNDLSQEDLITEIKKINADDSVTGMIVQLPLPDHIDIPLIIREIDPTKDVDGWHAYNLGKTFLSPEFEDLPPATPLGIIKLLDHYDVPIQGSEVVVVGASNIVGKPISTMLLNRNATVTTCNIFTKDLASHTKKADILIVAVGKAGLITGNMVKEGVTVIDVGINRKEDGSLCGDVNFEEVSAKARYISPVPGGVGPMTVAALILNIVRAAERRSNP